MRHFLTLKDFSKEEILEIIDLGLGIKKNLKNGIYNKELENKTLAMIFEKSSTRTRVSFESGMFQLGGHALFLSNRDIHLGRGEPVKDTARVISRMCDIVMIRTFEHSMIEEFASYSKVPVINGLTDSYHPVQLLADYMTIVEYNLQDDLVVAYVGDGNNMTHSWLMLAAKLGFELRIATPKGYEVDSDVLKDAYALAKESGAVIKVGNDPKEAIKNATVVTTDTWASMVISLMGL
jgi:ornithine carbamoyltransferase